MKNIKLPEFLEDLKKINLTGKVAYAIAKNRKLVENELEILQETLKESESFKKYQEERIELAKSHAKKDEKGNPVTETILQGGNPVNSFVIEDQKAWEQEFEALKEKHKEALNQRTEQENAFNLLMEEDSKLEFHKIEESEIPENATAQEVYTLLELTK